MAKDTLLILDKESHIQRTLKPVLEREKYIVLAVDTMERALQNFQEFEVAGLITEYRIDQSQSPEAIRELKKRFPELYVMMLAPENLEKEQYGKIMSSGIDDFFLKPISIEKILIHLKEGLRQRKIFVEKKRLQQRSNQIRTERNFREAVPRGESSPRNKSFTTG